jgi:hypothetical protein
MVVWPLLSTQLWPFAEFSGRGRLLLTRLWCVFPSLSLCGCVIVCLAEAAMHLELAVRNVMKSPGTTAQAASVRFQRLKHSRGYVRNLFLASPSACLIGSCGLLVFVCHSIHPATLRYLPYSAHRMLLQCPARLHDRCCFWWLVFCPMSCTIASFNHCDAGRRSWSTECVQEELRRPSKFVGPKQRRF